MGHEWGQERATVRIQDIERAISEGGTGIYWEMYSSYVVG